MSIPTYDQFFHPLLKALARHPEGVRKRQICDEVADDVGLTEAQREIPLPSGRGPLYINRIGWAYDRLRRKEYADSPRRGYWQPTKAGIELIRKHPDTFPDDLFREIKYVAHEEYRQKLAENALTKEETPPEKDESLAPQEQIAVARDQIRRAVADDLLKEILRCSPKFFESLVLDVLHAMDYGVDRSALTRIGGSGDGGIDGIINLDRLGLQKVYVQAKRWQNSVGRPDVQAFYGSLAGHRATSGVFITTSTFTKQAVEYAATVSGSLVLVNGVELANLMIEHGVGVSAQIIKIPKIDSDYFEDA